MIFVSTSCLKNGKNLFYVLEKYLNNGIINIEIGSSHVYEEKLNYKNIEIYIKKGNYQIHGYFPPLEKSLVINLASQNREILEKSITQTKRAIELTNRLGGKLYSLHAGMRTDPNPSELGKRFNKENIAKYDSAFGTFAGSLKQICNYAMQYNIDIAVENHVLAPFNLVDKKNKILLMCEQQEFIQLIKEVRKSNLGILLDLGHLNVTSRTLRFDRNIFIDEIKEYVKAIHIHHNNGIIDSHENIEAGSWELNTIKDEKFKKIPITLESINLSMDQIIKTKNLLERETN